MELVKWWFYPGVSPRSTLAKCVGREIFCVPILRFITYFWPLLFYIEYVETTIIF